MRNLIEYPLTQDEVLKSLAYQQAGIEAEEHYGDMRPLVLHHAYEIVKASFALLKGFDDRAKQPGMGFVIPFAEATALIKACDFGPAVSSTHGTKT